MSKVYIVFTGCYEDRCILKIFNKKEDADGFIKQIEESGCQEYYQYDNLDIEVWDTLDSLSVAARDCWRLSLFLKSKETFVVTSVWEKGIEIASKSIDFEVSGGAYTEGECFDNLASVYSYVSEEHALSKAKELYGKVVDE